MQEPIDRAIAKEELARIDSKLQKPHLLIGGLAVQQFHAPRNSKDIDLVCSADTARSLLDELYPSQDWVVADENEDDYRPSYRIRHKTKPFGTIIFGPKISEREPYKYIDWELLMKGATPFKTKKKTLKNILVPPAHGLAFSKFISFLAREEPEAKVEADLKDFVDLTNNEAFSISAFYDLLRISSSSEELLSRFANRSQAYATQFTRSCLYHLSTMALAPTLQPGVVDVPSSENLPKSPDNRNDKLVHDLSSWLLRNRADDPLVRGIALREVGEYRRSIEVLESAASSEPSYPRFFSNVAHAYAREGNLDQAIIHMLTAIEIRRRDGHIEWPRHHYHAARYYLKRNQHGDSEQAFEHLSRSIAAGDDWERAAIANGAEFRTILETALQQGRRIRKEARLAHEKTVDQVRAEVTKYQSASHAAIYGSHWLNGGTDFRDIDVAVVTNDLSAQASTATVMSRVYAATPINIYFIPSNVLVADVETSHYGQFFSFKFVLGVESVYAEPLVDACVLDVLSEAIREAVAWEYQSTGDGLFDKCYGTEWFLGLVVRRRVDRDPSFYRCLRRVFDHYNNDGISRILAFYGRALYKLKDAGDVVRSSGREECWGFEKKRVMKWAGRTGLTDGQVVDRFWKTYEELKEDGGKAVRAKKAMAGRLSVRARHDMDSRIVSLLAKGRSNA